MNNITTYTASEARKKFYSLIKKASGGVQAFEIRLRGSEPVVLMSKEEFEGWMETLDIMSSAEEAKAIVSARKDIEKGRLISHGEMIKKLGLQDEN